MASVTSNYHFYQDDDVQVKVDVRDDGDVWITVGDWPSSVTMFMTEAQAEKLRLSIVTALEEKYYDDFAFELASRAEAAAEHAREMLS